MPDQGTACALQLQAVAVGTCKGPQGTKTLQTCAREESAPLRPPDALKRRCLKRFAKALRNGLCVGVKMTVLARHTHWAHPTYAVGVCKVASGQA